MTIHEMNECMNGFLNIYTEIGEQEKKSLLSLLLAKAKGKQEARKIPNDCKIKSHWMLWKSPDISGTIHCNRFSTLAVSYSIIFLDSEKFSMV